MKKERYLKMFILYVGVIAILTGSLLTSGCVIFDSERINTDGKLFVNGENKVGYWKSHRRPQTVYPEKEYMLKKSACVTVLFTVGSDGNVYDPEIVRNYPDDRWRFNKSAIKTIKKFKFKPSDANAQRTPIRTTHTFNFIIAEGKAYQKASAELERQFEVGCYIDVEARNNMKINMG